MIKAIISLQQTSLKGHHNIDTFLSDTSKRRNNNGAYCLKLLKPRDLTSRHGNNVFTEDFYD